MYYNCAIIIQPQIPTSSLRKPRFQRQECHTGQSLHYIHGYAVRDRIDLSSYSDAVPAYVKPDPAVLLPSSNELSMLKDELIVLVSR